MDTVVFGASAYLPEEPRCPACAMKLSGATPVNATGGPDPGDFSVCVGCATLLRYHNEGKGLALRRTTEADRKELEETQPDTLELLDKLVEVAKIRLREEREKKKRWH